MLKFLYELACDIAIGIFIAIIAIIVTMTMFYWLI